MAKEIKYRGITSTKELAEAMAVSFLRQVTDGEVTLQTVNIKEYGSDTWKVQPSASGVEARKGFTPAVYINESSKPTHTEPGVYDVYLLFDRDRLPIIFRSVSSSFLFLSWLQPTIKPVDSIPVESILTKEGAERLDEALNSMEKEDSPTVSLLDRQVARAKEAPKGLRFYSFIDDMEMTLQDLKEEAENFPKDIAIADGELILNALTGETFKTEEEYLNALESFVGKKPVAKYKSSILDFYRICKTLRFVDFLEYELLRTEDYSYVQAHYSENASAIGYQEEYFQKIDETVKTSALDMALLHYLSNYIEFSVLFSGLSERRLANFLNIPDETLRRLYTDVRENIMI